MLHLRRREFVGLLAGAAASPLAARAQSALPVIGFLGIESPDAFAARLRGFRQGLSEAGYVENRNVAMEYRWAEGRFDRLSELAADLVRRNVDLIVTSSAPGVRAAKAATATIPPARLPCRSTGDEIDRGFLRLAEPLKQVPPSPVPNDGVSPRRHGTLICCDLLAPMTSIPSLPMKGVISSTAE
jgi:hypothetical protein